MGRYVRRLCKWRVGSYPDVHGSLCCNAILSQVCKGEDLCMWYITVIKFVLDLPLRIRGTLSSFSQQTGPVELLYWSCHLSLHLHTRQKANLFIACTRWHPRQSIPSTRIPSEYRFIMLLSVARTKAFAYKEYIKKHSTKYGECFCFSYLCVH